jgi:ABC-type phosphate transport system substrate-binding protein
MRLKSRMLGCLSALALCIGLALMMAPGSALATETCANITGSGSSLQTEQQMTWTLMVEEAGLTLGSGSSACTAKPTIAYTATSSGTGLSEFGVNEKEALLAKESGNKSTLDGYVGSDDPPTLEELKKIEKAGGETKALVVPTVAAPIVPILHPPADCDLLLAGLGFLVLNHLLDLAYSKLMTWSTFLLEVQKDEPGIAFKETGACLNHILVEVRSDSSGTSFAFKQYLCQIEPEVWLEKPGSASECNSPTGFVVDNPTWPSGPLIDKEHVNKSGTNEENKGSKGEANAVAETEGTIGYVNAANAVADKFAPYGAAAGHSLLTFWPLVNNKTEPVTGEKANCPTNTELSTVEEEEAKADMWGKIHLANPAQATGAYPICTLTYDIAFENYKTAALETAYGSGKGTEVGNTVSNYFLYMIKTGAQGQGDISPYYSKLSSGAKGIRLVAEELAKTVG